MEVSAVRSGLTIRQMTTAALVTAVTCVAGPIAIPIPVSPVPLSLTTLILYLSLYLLGMKGALVSCFLYLLLGIIGLPVFSGFSGGLVKAAGPTGGYLIGYLFLVLVSGFFIDRFPKPSWIHAAAMAAGTILCYAFGTLWLACQMKIPFLSAAAIGVLPYLPGDGVKIIVALTAGPILRRRVRSASF